jgi:hypothetical protein
LSLDISNHTKEKLDDSTAEARRGFFTKRRNNATESRMTTTPRRPSAAHSSKPVEERVSLERPAFHSDLHGQSTSSSKLQPRAVAIPYSRFKKERFYDWPPDPTVSRATPIVLYPTVPTDNDDSLSASVPHLPISDHDEHAEFNSSLRRRHSANVQRASDIPDSIIF